MKIVIETLIDNVTLAVFLYPEGGDSTDLVTTINDLSELDDAIADLLKAAKYI